MAGVRIAGLIVGLIVVRAVKAAAGGDGEEAAAVVGAVGVVRARLVRKGRRAVRPAMADRCDVQAYGFV